MLCSIFVHQNIIVQIDVRVHTPQIVYAHLEVLLLCHLINASGWKKWNAVSFYYCPSAHKRLSDDASQNSKQMPYSFINGMCIPYSIAYYIYVYIYYIYSYCVHCIKISFSLAFLTDHRACIFVGTVAEKQERYFHVNCKYSLWKPTSNDCTNMQMPIYAPMVDRYAFPYNNTVRHHWISTHHLRCVRFTQLHCTAFTNSFNFGFLQKTTKRCNKNTFAILCAKIFRYFSLKPRGLKAPMLFSLRVCHLWEI